MESIAVGSKPELRLGSDASIWDQRILLLQQVAVICSLPGRQIVVAVAGASRCGWERRVVQRARIHVQITPLANLVYDPIRKLLTARGRRRARLVDPVDAISADCNGVYDEMLLAIPIASVVKISVSRIETTVSFDASEPGPIGAGYRLVRRVRARIESTVQTCCLLDLGPITNRDRDYLLARVAKATPGSDVA